MHIVIGTAVAYYHYLLRPLLNTISHFLKTKHSLLMIVGQANRESQWELYDIISKGGYNVDSNRHEEKWKGNTEMLLYQLEMGKWQQQEHENENNVVEKDTDGGWSGGYCSLEAHDTWAFTTATFQE